MVTRTRHPMSPRHEAGFTLIELLVVVTIVGILASIAMINVRHAQEKARENALKMNLSQMRKAIDDYYADKQKFPGSLQDLVPNYMRAIPKDPITESSDTWVELQDDPSQTQGSGDDWDWNDSSSWGNWDDEDDFSSGGPGIVDVKSGAEGQTMDGTPYEDL